MQKNKFWLLLGLIGVDQLVSWLAKPAAVSGRFFHFLPQSSGLALAAVLLLVLTYLRGRNLSFALVFLWAGYISNLLSFLFHGYIKDYLPTGISYVNLADLYILAGILLLFAGLDFFHQSR